MLPLPHPQLHKAKLTPLLMELHQVSGLPAWSCCKGWAGPGEVGPSSPTSASQHPSNISWWGYIPRLEDHLLNETGQLLLILRNATSSRAKRGSALPSMLQNPFVSLEKSKACPSSGVLEAQSNPWRLTPFRAQGYGEHDEKRRLHPLQVLQPPERAGLTQGTFYTSAVFALIPG